MSLSSVFLPLANESWRHYLHREDAPLLLERIEQKHLVLLWGWFQSLHGGRWGSILAEEAPVFDLILERLCEPVGPVEDGADEFFSPIPARVGRGGWSRSLFGAGLMFASAWLEKSADEPFPREANLDELVDFIRNESWLERARGDREEGRSSSLHPGELTALLIRREPLLELPIAALARTVVNETGPDPWRLELPSHARALFFLGAMAAGLSIPEMMTQALDDDE